MEAETSWFWNERFWLPSNVTWSDLKNTDTAVYPRINDLVVVIPLAIIILVVRTAFERFIGTPLGRIAGIKSKNHYEATPNTILEKVYKTVSKTPDRKRLDGLAKQLDWSVRTVERWFRRRRNQDRPTMLVKFTETSWRSLFYLVVFSYGVSSVPMQPWFWDLRQCWHHFPFHTVTSEIYNYYMAEMAFYLSLILSLFNDVKRKDFIPQFIHHFATIFLLGFSWACNFTRIGCIVLLTHDVADIFLEIGKMMKYAQYEAGANCLFAVFTTAFFLSRIIFLPFWLIFSSLFQSLEIVGPFPAYYFFNGLLITLQILNSYWFFLISCMVYRAITNGQVTKDARSDVEESSSEDELINEKNGQMNHNHNFPNHVNSNYKAVANHH